MSIFLVRHARAGVRGMGPHDALRPLDDTGRSQALELVSRLDGRPVERIVSSPAVRCIQTVEPLARARDLQVGVHDALWEGQELEPALELLFMAAEAGGHHVLCSHGDLIPWIMGTLRSTGVPTDGRKQGCAKGSFWELSVEHGRIVHGLYHRID